MEKCEFRKELDPQLEKINKAYTESGIPGSPMQPAGFCADSLKQTFENGMCLILTRVDMAPVECRQPNCDETTCPDITHLRTT